MLVLGIESSCDETALAILEFAEGARPRIIAEIVSSQVDLHARYGGVVPELASREHLRNLPLVLEEVIERSGRLLNQLDLIGVTTGPGLKGCLLTGMSFAEGLAQGLGKPLVAVNHIEAHLLAPMLDHPDLEPPYLALVVSGGHTELVRVDGIGMYEVLGRTQDDAAGEAFDKSANLLGLAYPGGAKLAALADATAASHFTLPKVFRDQEGFSFSGLKTAVSRLVRDAGVLTDERKGELARTIQESIVEALIVKLERAVARSGLRRVVLTGGVSANRRLRARAQGLSGVKSYAPEMSHCVDNGAMIALVAGVRAQLNLKPFEIEVRPRWWVEELSPT